jgi:uncharacterized protein
VKFRRSKSRHDEPGTRIYFATDIHGSDTCFRKFLNAAAFYGTDVLILGGDVTGKLVVPIAEGQNGSYVARLGEARRKVGRDGLADFERDLRARGAYPYRVDVATLEGRIAQADVEEMFLHAMKGAFEDWLTLAEERLGGTDVKCFISPGNDDPWELDAVLAQSRFVANPEGRVVELPGGCEMITCGVTNETPWDSPREETEESLATRLRRLAAALAHPERAVFNLHCPPWNCGLDLAPELEPDLTVRSVGGNQVLKPVGSHAVREIIETVQPALGLHGHVHESHAAAQLGRTVCINPGSEYGDGILRGALVTLQGDGTVKSYQLVSG